MLLWIFLFYYEFSRQLKLIITIFCLFIWLKLVSIPLRSRNFFKYPRTWCRRTAFFFLMMCIRLNFLKAHSQVWDTWNPFKNDEKTAFVLEICKFLLWSFGHVEKKAKVGNFEIYDVTILGKTVTWNILTDISRSNGKKAMEFCQFIEYNTKNIFLEKSWTKFDA